ncbi:MAG: hypothetical protein IMF12_01855, partial [Proteobacteria bacterium]|nr:hypothetical protein [Pseudomonadota bacterium]
MRILRLPNLILLSMLLLATSGVQAAYIHCGGGGAIDAGQTLGCSLSRIRLVNGIHVSAGCNDGEFGHFTAYFSDGSQKNFYGRCGTTIGITPRLSNTMFLRMNWGGGGDSHISWYSWGVHHDPNAKISLRPETTDMTIEVGESIEVKASFIDIQYNAPYSYVLTPGDGNSDIGSVANAVGYKGNISVDYTYQQEGIFNAVLEITDNLGNTDSKQIRVNVVPTVTNDPCDPDVITLRSNLSTDMPFGMWNMPFTWDATRTPKPDDWVLIQAGHTILLPNDAQIKGLCIEQNGVLRSYFNSFANISNINLSAATIWNQGTISSSNGINGSVVNGAYRTAIAGSDIKIYTNRFLNDTTGLISANGRGGDDILYPIYQNGAGVVNAFGGAGGDVEIYP